VKSTTSFVRLTIIVSFVIYIICYTDSNNLRCYRGGNIQNEGSIKRMQDDI
jgi:hypothetical protein